MPYFIEPEVPGQLGEKTILDTASHPPVVKHLHFIFYGWLGDDLVECFPVFLITEKVNNELSKTNLTGYTINHEFEMDLSEDFKLIQPNTVIPNFYWLQIIGTDQDDFSISQNKLKISDTAYEVLRQFGIKNAIVEETASL